ncbi:MAG TPA: hypothetical protein DDW95_06050 [Alphaproteobacteria bacterium]|nr:hypothetical protein [Alphaproteobacteria bacterium]
MIDFTKHSCLFLASFDHMRADTKRIFPQSKVLPSILPCCRKNRVIPFVFSWLYCSGRSGTDPVGRTSNFCAANCRKFYDGSESAMRLAVVAGNFGCLNPLPSG